MQGEERGFAGEPPGQGEEALGPGEQVVNTKTLLRKSSVRWLISSQSPRFRSSEIASKIHTWPWLTANIGVSISRRQVEITGHDEVDHVIQRSRR